MTGVARSRRLRRLGRPVRRLPVALERTRNGMLHGWGRPARWPRGTWWPFGPAHPNDGRAVTVFAGGRSFTLVPAELRGRIVRYRGHRYDGVLRPAADELRTVLVEAGIEPATATADAIALAAISGIEGGFDALQTYDGARFSWGFVQFAASGGLPALLRAIATEQPAAFDRHFRGAGVGIDGNRLVVDAGDGTHLRGWRAVNRLHDDPDLWRPFLLAAFDPDIQRMQVLVAHRNYAVRSRLWTVPVGGRVVALVDLVGADPVGHAVVVDHAVHRGARYSIRLFERAALDAGVDADDIGSAATARAVLDAARRLEASDEQRWCRLTAAVGHVAG